MRIAIVLPGFSVDVDDWAIPAIQSLILGLSDAHDVTVFSLRYPPAGIYDVGGVQHLATGGETHFGLRSLSIVWQTVQAMNKSHRRRAFDIVHAFWADEAGLTAVIAGARLRIPVIISLGGGELINLPDIGYGTQGSKIRGLFTRWAMRRAAALSAGSNYQLQLAISKGASPKKLHLLPLGVDTKLFRPAKRPDFARPTIIQVASLVPVKNQALLLEVLARLRVHIPNVCLVMVGSGPMQEKLRLLATQAALDHNISWQGAIIYQEMPTQYQSAQLYLQTSRHESQGMAVLEAMACGLPIIGTPVGLLPEISARPASADPETLARYSVELLSRPKELQSLGIQTRQTAVDKYDLNHSVELFVSLYQSMRR